MVWFRHDILRGMNAVAWKKREGALGTKVEGCSFLEGVASHTAQARPLGFRIKKAEAPRATSLSNAWKRRLENRRIIIEIDQTVSLTRFFMASEGLKARWHCNVIDRSFFFSTAGKLPSPCVHQD